MIHCFDLFYMKLQLSIPHYIIFGFCKVNQYEILLPDLKHFSSIKIHKTSSKELIMFKLLPIWVFLTLPKNHDQQKNPQTSHNL